MYEGSDFMDLENLNKEQKEAVLHKDGPLLILAGAGSGKTRVLTMKVAYLIENGVEPSSILAITFTNKAAKEMKERIYKLVGRMAYESQISTFHSFGLKIIKENYNLLGYEKNFTILDSDDTLSLIKKIMKDMNIDPKQLNPKYVKNVISGAKNELINAIQYENYISIESEKIIGKIYRKYESDLIKNNSVDFDDLLTLPIKLFNEYPQVLKVYQEKYKYILIDEYQDTNEAQYTLTKMISAKYKNICVVGDNDQSVYSFRGANYKNILNFENDYKNAKVIMLEQNYRSTKTILKAANSVIKHNELRKDKNLWCENEDGKKIIYYRAYDERHEASYVISEIKKLLNEGELEKDIVIIYRTNAQSRVLEEEFLKSGIPYRIVGSFFFYNRKEIKDLIAYLKIIYNEKDDVNLMRVINVPKRGIGPKSINNLSNKASIEGISIFETIESGKELEFKKIIEELKNDSENSTLTELIDKILEKTGMKKELESEKSIEADIRLENLEEFKSITKNFEEQEGLVSLEDFLNEISLVSDIEEHKDNPNRITLMTIHSAKGLEFNNVFIVGMEESIFPHINSSFDKQDLEEERRLCYVAITRAKKRLYLVNAKRRRLFGRDSMNPPSRFINEINTDCIEITDNNKIEKKFEKESKLYNEDVTYNIGEVVYQDSYGEGIVVGIDDEFLTIAFSYPVGTKKFLKNHTSIRRK